MLAKYNFASIAHLLLLFLVAVICIAPRSDSAAPTSPAIRYLNLNHGLTLNVSIGTPEQNFSLTLNTVATGTWVRKTYGKLKRCDFDIRLPEKRLYLAEFSETSIELYDKWSQEYTVGLVYMGKYYKDRMQIGDMTLEDQPFQVLDLEVGGLSGHFNFEGMLGIGSEGRLGHRIDPFKTMHDQGLIPNRVLSLHLDQRDYDQQFNGTLIVGGTDSRYFVGPINHVPAMRLWEFELDYIQFESSNVTQFVDKTAWIDSTSNIIFGPRVEVKAILQQLDLKYHTDYGLNRFTSCKEAYRSKMKLSISIGGNRYELDAKDLIIKLRWRQQDACFLALSGDLLHFNYRTRENQHWILGTPFLRRYYTVYDYELNRVGFANATKFRSGDAH